MFANRSAIWVGRCGRGQQWPRVAKPRQLRPHIAVLDIGMPLVNGLEAARRISKSGSATPILVLTVHESNKLIQQVLETGAQGYVLKAEAGRALVSAIEALSQKNTFFTSKVGQTTARSDRSSRGPPRVSRQQAVDDADLVGDKTAESDAEHAGSCCERMAETGQAFACI